MFVPKPTAVKTADKLGIALRKGADARSIRRSALCLGGCDRTDKALGRLGVKFLSALLAESGYGRRIVCLDCLLGQAKDAKYWPSVHGQGVGAFDWRIELAPYGSPDMQEGVTVQLYNAKGWHQCLTDKGLVWRAAEPSIKWTKLLDSLEFQGLHGTVQVWTRPKANRVEGWTPKAKFVWRGAEHMREVLQACKG